MNDEMMKSLASLIDESLAEIEELKKSDRFSASEISMGDSEGLAGKDKNGSIGKEEDKKKDKEDEDEDDMDKGEGKNSEADPNAGSHKVAKKDEESETLMKSYVDEKVGGLESKLEAIAKAVQDLANSPVPSKGSTYKNVQPLVKSMEETETLSKSQVVDRLFDLKKSGEKVDTTDIASAELGSDLAKIIQKYNIK